jgi:hypothetical protein
MNLKSMKFCLLVISVLFSTVIKAQIDRPEDVFDQYELLSVSTLSLFDQAKSSNRSNTTYKIGKWEMELQNSNLLADNFRSVNQDGSLVGDANSLAIPMQGYTKEGGRVSLTIGDGFIYGFVNEGQESYYLEPARYYRSGSNEDDVIVYNIKDVKPQAEQTCGYVESQKVMKEKESSQGNRSMGSCYEVEYAIVNDCSMVSFYGDVGATNHVIGVTNTVQGDYDNAFSDQLNLFITGIYNVNCSLGDPWTSSLSPFDLLDEFTGWGNHQLDFSHDVASLWTRRNFSGTTVGLAAVGAVCTPRKYNVLENRSNSGGYDRRVLTSHELGHNFGAEHDAAMSGFIMAPSLSITSTWSAASITSIQDYYGSISCLEVGPPGCFSGTPSVQFTSSSSSTFELSGHGVGGFCQEDYIDFIVPVRISPYPSSNVVIGITASNSSTADAGFDFDLLTSSVTFMSGTSTDLTPSEYAVKVRIYNDHIEEVQETIILNLSITSGAATAGSTTSHTINIKNDDQLAVDCCVGGSEKTFGAFETLMTGIFKGDESDMKSRFIIPASDLLSVGLSAGNLDQMSFYVFTKTSTGAFQNFRIGLKSVFETNLDGVPWYNNTSQVYLGDVTTIESAWNNITFQNPYYWDGTSNLYVQVCFNNSSAIGDDLIVGFDYGGGSVKHYNFASENSGNGCTLNVDSYSFYNSDLLPNIKLRQSSAASPESTPFADANGYIRTGETARMISGDGEIIASIKNVGAVDIGCVYTTIETTGNGKSNLPFGSFQYSNKTMNVETDNEAVYELTLYYKNSEVTTWGADKLKLNFAQTSSQFSSATEGNTAYIFSKTVDDNVAAGDNVAYTAVVKGPGVFALTNAYTSDIKGDMGSADLYVDMLGGGMLMKNTEGNQYLVTVNTAGEIVSTLNNAATGKSKFITGDFYLNTASKGLIFKRSGNTYTLINVDASGVLTTSNTSSLPSDYINIEGGNFMFPETGTGIVFKSSNGNCYKLYVDLAGDACVSEVPCGS